MLETRIQGQFFESADALYHLAESLTPALALAAQAVVATVTGGGRLWCGGTPGAGAAEAEALAAHWCLGFEQARPGLAAMALPAALGSLQGAEAAAAALQSGAQAGDLLLWIEPEPLGSRGADGSALLQLARELEVGRVVVSGGDDAALHAALTDLDVGVRLGALRRPRVLEVQRVALHALCDAVDAHLLGLE